MAKILIAVVWILSLAAWTPALGGAFASAVRWAAPLMAVAHVVEFFVFREVFEKAGGSLGGHFLQTFLFGVFHINPLKEQLGAA